MEGWGSSWQDGWSESWQGGWSQSGQGAGTGGYQEPSTGWEATGGMPEMPAPGWQGAGGVQDMSASAGVEGNGMFQGGVGDNHAAAQVQNPEQAAFLAELEQLASAGAQEEPAESSSSSSSEEEEEEPPGTPEPVWPEGTVVYYDEAGSLGIVGRLLPKDKRCSTVRYTVLTWGKKVEVKKADGCFQYFGYHDLRECVNPPTPPEPSDSEAEEAPDAPVQEPPEKKQRSAPVIATVESSVVPLSAASQAPSVSTGVRAAPRAPPLRPAAMGNLKSVLNNMFTAPKRQEGRIRWFNKEKGFGRISPLVPKEQMDIPEEVFIHKNAIELGVDGPNYAGMNPGALVTYELGKKDGKPNALRVRCEGRAKLAISSTVGDGGKADPVEDSRLRNFVLNGLVTGAHQAKGNGKAVMEDRFVQRAGFALNALGDLQRKAACAFFAVFDGHAGVSCSEFAATNLDKSVFDSLRDQNKQDVSSELALRSALLGGFKIVEHNFLQYANKLEGGAARAWASSGSTACAAVLYGPDEKGRLRLMVANIGDSRAVLGKRDGLAVRLSEDHTPNVLNERKRIEQNGGTVSQVGGIWRVLLKAKRGAPAAGLSVSRSFGDIGFKVPKEVVSAVPEISTFLIDRDEDIFIILASDGVWGAISDMDAVRHVAAALRESGEDPAKQAAERLVKVAHEHDDKDDKTALVVWFGGMPNEGVGVIPAETKKGDSKSDTPVTNDIFEGGAAPDALEMAELDDLFSGIARDMGVDPAAPAELKPESLSGGEDPKSKRKALSNKVAKKVF